MRTSTESKAHGRILCQASSPGNSLVLGETQRHFLAEIFDFPVGPIQIHFTPIAFTSLFKGTVSQDA